MSYSWQSYCISDVTCVLPEGVCFRSSCWHTKWGHVAMSGPVHVCSLYHVCTSFPWQICMHWSTVAMSAHVNCMYEHLSAGILEKYCCVRIFKDIGRCFFWWCLCILPSQTSYPRVALDWELYMAQFSLLIPVTPVGIIQCPLKNAPLPPKGGAYLYVMCEKVAPVNCICFSQ